MADFRYAQTNIQLFEQLRQGGVPEAERARVAAAYDLAARLFTGRFRCSGKTFLAHLVGTASVAARHGGSEPAISAALLHAAYDEGNFGTLLRGLTADKREMVRRAVGAEVEQLVVTYTALSWHRAMRPALVRRLPDFSDQERKALFIRMANELEETLDGGFLYCSAERQDDMRDSVTACREICRALDMPALLSEIEETYRRYSASRPAATADEPRNGSYLLPPASMSTRPGLRVWRAARRLWEFLLPRTLRSRVKTLLRLSK